MTKIEPTSEWHEPQPAGAPWFRIAGVAGLLVLVAAVYFPTLSNGFIWDDPAYVEQNTTLRSLGGLSDVWFKPGAVPQYYPLTHTTLWIEYQLWGLDPRGYHAVNLLLHLVSSVLVWRLLARLRVPGAWLAAAIFAVHPINVESVAWVTERKNVLSCALALGALLAYLRFSPPEPSETGPDAPPPRPGCYWLALALYVAALLAKTVTVSVPAVLLVIYWWKRGRLDWREAVRLVPFFVIGLALASITAWLEVNHAGASGDEWNLSPGERVLVAGRVVWFYAGKLAWPHPLIFFYPRWTIDAHLWWQYLFPLTAVAVPIVLWSARKRIGRAPLAAALVFGGVLVPCLGFFNVYPFRFSYVADHFQYHAGIALIALAAAGWQISIAARLGPKSPWLAPAIAAAVLAPLALVAWQRTHVYRNLRTLYEDVLAQNPTCWVALHNLGRVCQEDGKPADAAALYRESLALHPRDSKALYNLGTVLAELGDPEQAIKLMNEVLAVEPDADLAEHSLGILFYNAQQTSPAIEHLTRAVRLQPSYAKWRVDLAVALLKNREFTHAEIQLRRAIALDPRSADAHNYLGAILSQRGDLDGSIAEFAAALKSDPRHPLALENLQTARAAKDRQAKP